MHFIVCWNLVIYFLGYADVILCYCVIIIVHQILKKFSVIELLFTF